MFFFRCLGLCNLKNFHQILYHHAISITSWLFSTFFQLRAAHSNKASGQDADSAARLEIRSSLVCYSWRVAWNPITNSWAYQLGMSKCLQVVSMSLWVINWKHPKNNKAQKSDYQHQIFLALWGMVFVQQHPQFPNPKSDCQVCFFLKIQGSRYPSPINWQTWGTENSTPLEGMGLHSENVLKKLWVWHWFTFSLSRFWFSVKKTTIWELMTLVNKPQRVR